MAVTDGHDDDDDDDSRPPPLACYPLPRSGVVCRIRCLPSARESAGTARQRQPLRQPQHCAPETASTARGQVRGRRGNRMPPGEPYAAAAGAADAAAGAAAGNAAAEAERAADEVEGAAVEGAALLEATGASAPRKGMLLLLPRGHVGGASPSSLLATSGGAACHAPGAARKRNPEAYVVGTSWAASTRSKNTARARHSIPAVILQAGSHDKLSRSLRALRTEHSTTIIAPGPNTRRRSYGLWWW